MALAEYFRVLAHIAAKGVNLIASLTDVTPFGLIAGSGAPSGAYDLVGTRGLYFREDGGASTLIYYTLNGGTNWTALVGTGTTDFGGTGIKADVVAESGAGSGVTVDGCLIKDGDAASATSAKALAAASVFLSNELTGNGSAQNTAHGLGSTPVAVIAIPSNLTGGAFVVAYGAHNATNAVATVTTGEKYRILAIK